MQRHIYYHGNNIVVPYNLKFSRISWILSGLEIFILENFGPSQTPLEKSCKTSKILSRKFVFKGKITEPRKF